MSKYTEANIKSYQGLEGIRKRPSMYLGDLRDAVWTCLREAADNTVDEALAGHNSICYIVINKDGSYTVADRGRGIPVGPIKVEEPINHKVFEISALKATVSLLHTGGKFDDKVYKTSRGVHGAGIKGVNAVSTQFQVWTFQKNRWWSIRYEKGKLSKDLFKSSPPKVGGKEWERGTVIQFTPDLSIIKGKLKGSNLLEWSRVTSYLTRGFKIVVRKGSKKWVFYEKEGPKAFLKSVIEKYKCEALGSHFYTTSPLADVALAFTDYDGMDLRGYSNGLGNLEGGVHVNATYKAIFDAIKPFMGKRQTFGFNEIKEGVVGLVNAKLSAPKFDSQTKEKLVDERADEPLRDLLVKEFTQYFRGNKSLARRICERCVKLKELKQDFTASKKVLKRLNRIKRKGFPVKFVASIKSKPEQRELYLVEGDSAGGCFSGETEVQLLNGKTKTFKELLSEQEAGKRHLGYAHSNKSGRIRVVELEDVRITGHVSSLIEVKLDNDEIVRCTPDHKWKLKSGLYLAAKDLTEGHSLMPHYEKIRGGRRQVWHPSFNSSNGLIRASLKSKNRDYTGMSSIGRWGYIYKLVAKFSPRLREEKAQSKINSNPEYQKKRKFALKDTHKKKLWAVCLLCDRLNFKEYENASRVYMERTGLSRAPKFTSWRRFYLSWKDFKSEWVNRKEYVEQKQAVNHKVVSVRKINLKKKIPVYDLSVEKHHNFALGAGIYVHNSAKQARDKNYQEILPLKGKIQNAIRNPQKALNSNEIINILAVVGVTPNKPDPLENIRIGRLILLSDSDVDGYHINSLILSCIHKFMPKLFSMGKVYVVEGPEYYAEFKGKLYSSKSQQKLLDRIPDGAKIKHIKGWGEIGPDKLEHFAFNPETRKLIRVMPVQGKDRTEFIKIMGNDSSTRKKLLGV